MDDGRRQVGQIVERGVGARRQIDLEARCPDPRSAFLRDRRRCHRSRRSASSSFFLGPPIPTGPGPTIAGRSTSEYASARGGGGAGRAGGFGATGRGGAMGGFTGRGGTGRPTIGGLMPVPTRVLETGILGGATGAPLGLATPSIVALRSGGRPGLGSAAGASGLGMDGGAPSTGLGPVARGSRGGSTWNDVPHLGHRILRPLDGTRLSSTW